MITEDALYLLNFSNLAPFWRRLSASFKTRVLRQILDSVLQAFQAIPGLRDTVLLLLLSGESLHYNSQSFYLEMIQHTSSHPPWITLSFPHCLTITNCKPQNCLLLAYNQPTTKYSWKTFLTGTATVCPASLYFLFLSLLLELDKDSLIPASKYCSNLIISD